MLRFPISREQADELLRKDVDRFEACVLRVSQGLQQHQFDAMVCLAFNIGEEAFTNSSVARFLRKGDYTTAAVRILDWVKGGKPLQTLPGLVRRRKSEQFLFLNDALKFQF